MPGGPAGLEEGVPGEAEPRAPRDVRIPAPRRADPEVAQEEQGPRDSFLGQLPGHPSWTQDLQNGDWLSSWHLKAEWEAGKSSEWLRAPVTAGLEQEAWAGAQAARVPADGAAKCLVGLAPGHGQVCADSQDPLLPQNPDPRP